jgi:hypothetical protein
MEWSASSRTRAEPPRLIPRHERSPPTAREEAAIELTIAGGPRVRIRLPPAVSHASFAGSATSA